MQFDKQKFALASAGTMTVVYLVCAVFTALWPGLALKFAGWMLHLVNVEKFAGDVGMTLGGFFFGLLPILFYSYLAAWFFAWLYNRFTRPVAR